MEQVSMNDGVDGRDTVAFGLGAAEVAVLVLGLLSAYGALQFGLPGAVSWALASCLALLGVALAWVRIADRSLLEWAVLLVGFLARTRHARVGALGAWARGAGRAVRRRWHARRGALGTRLRAGGVRLTRSHEGAVAMALALALRRHPDSATPDREPRRPPLALVPDRPQGRRAPAVGDPPDGGEHAPTPARLVAFFSLAGGSGRTALAVEVAALAAVRGAAERAGGGPGRRVALLDLTRRSPAVALRLGITIPAEVDPAACLATHPPGLLVFAGPVPRGGCGAATVTWMRTLIGAARERGAGIVVVDIDCDLGELCVGVLELCDQVYVTVRPTAGGVLDAYRSTAALRRLGMRDRISYVVNGAGDDDALDQAMGDLGGEVVARIPEDASLVEAENHHRPAGLDGDARCAPALAELVAHVEEGAAGGDAGRLRWGARAG
jgi:cellulose biosynthesis protein BcsQ